MASKADIRKCQRLLDVIKNNGTIGRFELIDEARMGIGAYNAIKPYFEERFSEWVEYDKSNKSWSLKPEAAKQISELEKECGK